MVVEQHQETLSVDGLLDKYIRLYGLIDKYDKRKANAVLTAINAAFSHTKIYDEAYIKSRIDKLRRYCKQLMALKQIPVIEQRSEEWYKTRKEIITASDFAQALGDGKFGTQKQIFQKKCGYEEEKFNPSLPPLKWGTMFEPVASAIYSERNGCTIHEFGLVRHPTVDYFGASPDGITDYGIMVEIKCPFKRKITGEVPLQYYYQIQGQLDVCGLEECDYLECEFATYGTMEELCASGSRYEVGVIEEFADPSASTGYKYRYSKTYTCLNESTISEIDDWLTKDGTCTRVHYWRLVILNVVRIYKNNQFVQEKLAALGDVWNKVQTYQENRQMYDLEVATAVKKEKAVQDMQYSKMELKGYAFKDTE